MTDGATLMAYWDDEEDEAELVSSDGNFAGWLIEDDEEGGWTVSGGHLDAYGLDPDAVADDDPGRVMRNTARALGYSHLEVG